ncbi:alpha/beta family hydrolase [Longimicrobium sp.]|uniref:alpha/beta hydrolase family protein n=1 Tax=Longimicrobium sp. TaxID=2029185 RepID=UPI002C5D7638|nr:alpha/beta family hydrolase [Longimicrobium sp.]HSU14148.1 alpha/beta family hydrolase [Longimicrobium sp.]
MATESVTWRVKVGDAETVAVFDAADSADGRNAVFVCAHGAGGNRDDRGMVAMCAALRSRGMGTVRFNFLYREKGSGRPDPMPRLMETVAAVVARVRDELRPEVLLTGGRSMGGRAASMLAADGFASDGLLLMAYPLHPAGQPEKLRDAHLPSITIPVLCFNGTRDDLCRRDLMERALQTVKTDWTMHWLEGADHSFHVLKSSGRSDAQVLDEVADATRAWVARLGSPSPAS